MARITHGLTTSHIPAIAAMIDQGRTGEDYWKPIFERLPVDQAILPPSTCPTW